MYYTSGYKKQIVSKEVIVKGLKLDAYYCRYYTILPVNIWGRYGETGLVVVLRGVVISVWWQKQ